MYYYETLGDERFQEFCQALISTTFPNAQCLPVGQPDGGRDAYLIQHALAERRRKKQSTKDIIVFQVKYVRDGTSPRQARDFIEEIAKREKPKIDRLKALGVTKYYLITNVQGTSHLGSGSIDKVNEQLEQMLGVEAFCWWRDDLDRRLDGHTSVKWSYPEVLKATDLLQALVAGQLGEDEERRRAAVRAYITAQYEDEQELKFKQTDLRSTMTDLFVDLPMRASFEGVEDSIKLPTFWRRERARMIYQRSIPVTHDGQYQNAAEYFLKMTELESTSRIVLEGAPGQGKSTVTQFICQVLRMKLLGKGEELGQLPRQFQESTIRIPFRVDLRDLAKWVDGVDPFQSKPVTLDEREPLSLEGFLAGQVRFLSGGHAFNVSDLTAVARSSHILLALDGFDEVADTVLREKLVLEITKGSSRLLNAGGYSVNVIVTSRPAAFAKSIRFPRDQWIYFELLPLERRQVDDYAVKWMKAKGLKELERQALARTLDAKLRETHTQFLAKNPMQLTILLSLINSRGSSLPEKRTAMYDSYMDMFFNRESDKSDIVRENRDLLVDIHRFLAWKLQTSAEAGENGSIEQGALRTTLFSYLDSQGEDTSIVGDLFDGIIERVGALVSRVQNTYEFEVQPLREYFAARHLYETAPYSPAGDEKSGTKLDRFDALLRNPYWLNVARFYGGCFSKGEISALVDELMELAGQGPYKHTSHPRSVALMLLSDWVFTQYQPAVKKIVAFIGQYPQLLQLLASAERAGGTTLASLPERSGRNDFFDIVWKLLIVAERADERQSLAKAAVQNSSFEERFDRWRAAAPNMPHSAWVRLGGLLAIYHDIAPSKIQRLGTCLSNELLASLLDADRFDCLEGPEHQRSAQDAILWKSRAAAFPMRAPAASIGLLAAMKTVFGYYQYGVALTEEYAVPVEQAAARRLGIQPSAMHDLVQRASESGEITEQHRAALEAYIRFIETPASVTSTSVDPWIDLVESLRRAWGDAPAIDRIAFMGAGVRSTIATNTMGTLQGTNNLVAAARYMRMKSGAPTWWTTSLHAEEDINELRRKLLLLWIWGTPKTLIKMTSAINAALERLGDFEWSGMCRDFMAISFARRQGGEPESGGHTNIPHLKGLSARTCMFVGQRLPQNARYEFAIAISKLTVGEQTPEGQFAMDTLITKCREEAKWKSALPHIIDLYKKGATARFTAMREEASIPTSIAEKISLAADHFPLPIVAIADAQLTSSAGADAAKLLDVANREGWFRC